MKISCTIKMIGRNWVRNLLSTAISVVSLTVGLVCTTTLTLYVLDEWRTSRGLVASDGVYQLKTANAFYGEQKVMIPAISKRLPLNLSERYPEVQAWVSLTPRQQFKWGDLEQWDPTLPDIFATTPGLTDLFMLPVEQGDLRRTLQSPGEIAISRSFARRYFGVDAPMGREVVGAGQEYHYPEGLRPVEVRYTVTTILDDSKRSPLSYSGFVAMPADELEARSQFGQYYGFVQLKAGTDPQEFAVRVQADSTLWVDTVSLVAARQIYFGTSHQMDFGFKSLIKSGNLSLLYVGLTASLVILIIACFNYVNITMTRSTQRIKNMAGQRIMGASRWNVRWQTVLDTTLLVLFSFGLAVMLLQAVLPPFNSVMNTRLTLGMLLEGPNVAAIGSLLLLVVALSSLFVLLKIESGGLLNAFRNPGGSKLRIARILVIAQFVVSVVLVAVSLCVSRQMTFIARALPATEQIIDIRGHLPHSFADAARSQAGVQSSLVTLPIPQSSISNNGFNCNLIWGEPGYFDFYRINIVEGRALSAEDVGQPKVVVNQTFVRRKEWDQPVGQTVEINGKDRTVVGVMEDYRTDNVHNVTQPLAVLFDRDDEPSEFVYNLLLKVSGDADMQIDALKALWRQLAPNQTEPTFSTLAQTYRNMNSAEERLRQIMLVFAVVSMFLAALGLFGLAWYSVGQRAREIALRRIHGASIAQMILLLCRHFLSWMLIAVVIALPLAWWLSAQWLTEFVYKAPLSPWIFVGTFLMAIAITLVTVIFQSWRAATANPVSSLKTE